MKLRDYQNNFVIALATMLMQFRKVLGQLATGGGKTITFAAIADRYLKKNLGKRVLILVDRKELLQQTRRTLYNGFGINCFAVVAGVKYIPQVQVYVAMVDTSHRRISMFKDIGLVIIDECHKATFNKMHDFFKEQLIIGFTATPISSSTRMPMKKFYDTIVCGIDIPDLIASGDLCQNVTYAPKDTVDRLELVTKGDSGEFDEREMSDAFSKSKCINNTVKAYKELSEGIKTIIFNVDVAHSVLVTKAFVDAGYNARHVDGTMGARERDELFAWYAVTPDAILNNVGIATTGFDEPSIETVIINKATNILTLWLQMCGRGARPTKTKSMFTIIDMGGNAITHGDWSQPRDWEFLFNNPPKPGTGGNVAPVKSCINCEAIIPAGSMKCKHCGYEYTKDEVSMEQELGEFIVLTKNIDVAQIVEANREKKEYAAFFEIGRTLALTASQTILIMSDENATFIIQKYFDEARKWMRLLNEKKRPKKLILNQWHQNLAREHLYQELKKYYIEWVPFLDTYKRFLPMVTEQHIKDNVNVKAIAGGIVINMPLIQVPDWISKQPYINYTLTL